MYTEIKKDIHWIGAVDWNVRDFHGYNTERGATYNSYLVQDEKTAVIDTVKAPFAADLITRIAELTPLEKVDYVICNHAEPDHSGALPILMAALPNATLVCNKKTLGILQGYYDASPWKVQLVKTGDTLALGTHTVTFVEVPLVHWPDSMVTYMPDQKILFSNDAFGQHYSSSRKFDDENPLCTLIEEARIYYANIVVPYSKRVKAVLESLGGLAIDMICPSHGCIWRSHVDEILKAYTNWANNALKAKVVIAYDTMWNSTGIMAEAIADGAARQGVDVKVINLRKSNNTKLATEVLDSAAVALGSSTLNQGMLSDMAGAVCYLQGMNMPGKASLAFGSFGWGKGGPEALQAKMPDLNWNPITEEPLKAKFRPTPEVLQKCSEMGKILAEKAIAIAEASGYQKLVTD